MGWCIEHPWMTFFIAILLIETVCISVENICKTIISTRKESIKDMKKTECFDPVKGKY